MKKRAYLYNLINIIVLLLAVFSFCINYCVQSVFNKSQIVYVLVIGITVVIVHFFKAIRLYFALYESNIAFSKYLKIYCKVTPISMLYPFKIGEFFRMYCYGVQTGNVLKGIVTVILDRFMDTIALLTLILLLFVIYGGVITTLVYVLLGFTAAAVIVFWIFPGSHKYWIKYLLKANATPRKIKAIKFLDALNYVYDEVASVTKGRGIILYILSLIAWAVEIGSVVILHMLKGDDNNLSMKISKYLSSALSSTQSEELKQFIFISVILMMFMYVLVKLIELALKERE